MLKFWNSFNREIKLILGIALLTFAVLQFIEGNIGNGIFCIVLLGIVIFLLFFNENMIAAIWQMRKQNMPAAEHALNRILKPEKLMRRQKGYYYFMQGNIAAQHNIHAAEKHFRKALSVGLKSDQEQAMVKLSLAGVAIAKRRKQEATKLISEVKKQDKKGMLKDQVKMYQQQLKRI